jgi:transposase-like protein
MSKSKRMSYSETFKLEVLRDYYSSGKSKSFICRKWNLKSLTDIRRWMACYPIDSEALSLPSSTIKMYQMKQEEKSREELLQEEVLNLRRALEMEKLRSRAFEKLMEITEEKEGISILKKAGAKQ